MTKKVFDEFLLQPRSRCLQLDLQTNDCNISLIFNYCNSQHYCGGYQRRHCKLSVFSFVYTTGDLDAHTPHN